jgi:hypothetical protein
MNGEPAVDGGGGVVREITTLFSRRDATEKLRLGSQDKGRYWTYERGAC